MSGMRTTPSRESRLMMVMEMNPPTHAATHARKTSSEAFCFQKYNLNKFVFRDTFKVMSYLKIHDSTFKNNSVITDLVIYNITYCDISATFPTSVLVVTVVRVVVVTMVNVFMRFMV